ncbi:MAG: hypothetical protein WC058_06935, partial [Phycisphaeraceae bacterium]
QLAKLHQIAERFTIFAASGGGDQLAQFGDGVGVAIENVALPFDGFVVCGFGFVIRRILRTGFVRRVALLPCPPWRVNRNLQKTIVTALSGALRAAR